MRQALQRDPGALRPKPHPRPRRVAAGRRPSGRPAPGAARPPAALHRAAGAQRLANRGAGAGAHRPCRDLGRGRAAGAVSVLGGRPAVRLRSRRQVEVEDDRRRDDRHHARRPNGEPAAALLQPAHHPVRGAQAVCRAAGEQHGIDVSHEVAGGEGVDLARAGGATAHGAGGAHSARWREDHGAPGRGPEVGPVPDGDARHGGEIRRDGFAHRSAKIAWLARVVEGTYVSAMTKTDAQAAPTTVLVVDDEEGIRQALDRFLTRLGYRVLQAASGAEALDRQAAEQPQVMLSDIRMPNMTGVELVPKALAQDSDLAVIMLTAIDEPRTAIECMKLGAYDYLIKPVDLDELEMSLQGALRLRQLEVDRRQLEQWLAREVAVRTRDLEERTTVAEEIALSALAAARDWAGADDAIEKLAKELGTSAEDVAREVEKRRS